MPRVSVIIPIHNREKLLPATLDSMAKQTLGDWECLLVDDDSADDSFQVASEYATRDGRFVAFRRKGERGNANVCRNQGLAASSGEYIVFLDSDDLLAPSCLEKRVQFMDLHGELDFVVFSGELFLLDPGDLGQAQNSSDCHDDLTASLTLDHPWGTPNPIWRRKSLLKVGPWDEGLVKWQDVEFHVRALVKGLRYARSSLRDVYVRVDGGIGLPGSPKPLASPEALRKAEGWLATVEDCLRQHGAWNSDRSKQLGALYFWFALRMCEYGNLPQSMRTWRRAAERNLVSWFTLLQGMLLLFLLRWKRFVPGFDWLCPISRWKRRNGLLTAY